MIHLRCVICGKIVSTPVEPVGDIFLVRAAIECPECIEKKPVQPRLFYWMN